MKITLFEEAKNLGLRRYFTGEQCCNGHASPRQVSNKTCIECQRIARNAWRAKNPDKESAANKAYRLANPEKLRAKESRRVRDREKVNKTFRLWAAANREKYIAGQVAWKVKNPKRAMLIKRAYKARKRSAVGTYSAANIDVLFEKQDGVCAYFAYCGRRIDGEFKFHIDHVMPLALGGSNFPKNLQLLCQRCNHQKGALRPEVFEARISSNPPAMSEVIGRAILAAA